MTGPNELIKGTDERTLVGAVMVLTGGSANPAVVAAHAQRIKGGESPAFHLDHWHMVVCAGCGLLVGWMKDRPLGGGQEYRCIPCFDGVPNPKVAP